MKDYRTKFKLLMWKHYHLRKHHYFATFLEVFAPIGIMFLLCHISSKAIGDSSSVHADAMKFPSTELRYALQNAQGYTIVYTPATTVVSTVMTDAANILNYDEPKGVADEAELELFISRFNDTDMRKRWVGVVFMNDSIGRIRGYKIRMVDVWKTRELFPEDQSAKTTHNDPYWNQGFAGIQIALDTSIIKRQNPHFTIQSYYESTNFQPFPYPEYVQQSDIQEKITSVLILVLVAISLMLALPLISTIIEEKDTGLRELMKIVGIEEWLLWITWFLYAFIACLISYTSITFILYYNFNGKSAAIENVSPTVLWSFLMLFCIAHIAFCFTFSAIFHSATLANTFLIFVYVIVGYVTEYLKQRNWLWLTQLVCCVPVGALLKGFSKVKYAESHAIYLDWLSLNSVGDVQDISLGSVFLTLIFDTCLYMLLTYYITMINPGKYGSKKSPYFIFDIMFSTLVKDSEKKLLPNENITNGKYFEKVPSSAKVSICIKNLYKDYGSNFAVKNVNLNIYKGEITALLGHNGAGKTTTMGILTGIVKATAGTIAYENEPNILRNIQHIRKDLGVCVQEDRLFPYLSTKNHLIFFGMLKGLSNKEATEEAMKYLNLMEMQTKTKDLPNELSGGMKRKLCLATALIGNTKTLILDEPTSGLDVESRRKVWDLLLKLRGDRTILLSTHYMEEADALGDRIAIMTEGSIVCHGTAMFLKKVYETGYHLTIMKSKDKVTALTNAIKSNVTDTMKLSETDKEIVYKLPLTETTKFSNLFKELEERKEHLGIANMGVTCTTMEQVFLKVGGSSMYDLKQTLSKSSTVDGNFKANVLGCQKTGLSLIIQQLKALFKKRFLSTFRDRHNLFSWVIYPSLLLIVIVLRGFSRVDTNSREPPLTLSLATYHGSKSMISNDVPGGLGFCEQFRNYFIYNGNRVIDSDNKDIEEGLLNFGRRDLPSYEKALLFGVQCSTDKKKLLYNTLATHSLPVLINAYSNILLHNVTDDSGGSIIAVNHPIHDDGPKCDDDTMTFLIYVMWYVAIGYYTVDFLNFFSLYLCVERVNGFKHVQFMSNLSPFVYWLSNLTWDTMFFIIIIVMRLFVFKFFDEFNFLTLDTHFVLLVMFIITFAASGLLYSYVVNYFATKKSNCTTFLNLQNIIGMFYVSFFYVYHKYYAIRQEEYQTAYYYMAKYVTLLNPTFNYALAMMKFISIWMTNSSCSRCSDSIKETCEKNLKELSYLVFDSKENPDGVLTELIFLVVDAIICIIVLISIEKGLVTKFWNFLCTKIYTDYANPENDSSSIDVDVKTERDNVRSLSCGYPTKYVESRINTFAMKEYNLEQAPKINENVPLNGGNISNAILLVDELKKNFLKRCSPFTAVSNVTFGVRAGQCFGLLGVNGAGKSTTFKMLTACLQPTRGDASIMGCKLSKNKTTYLSKAGYCDQMNCFVEELTGREMLTLIASLRGVCTDRIDGLVEKWISILGLEVYQNRRCVTYSGGNKRKLCTAMSLIGDPYVVFLDEPTTGVDPISRRKLYDVMEQSKHIGQTVVLSSHCMEECENLCDRLTIMCAGKMKCIGSVQHLKQRYALGYSILIKLDDVAEMVKAVDAIQMVMVEEFEQKFCFLKDKHHGLLYYRIKNTSLLWSELFEKMEKIKANNDVVEDYTISDTSLEEVFIWFAESSKVC